MEDPIVQPLNHLVVGRLHQFELVKFFVGFCYHTNTRFIIDSFSAVRKINDAIVPHHSIAAECSYTASLYLRVYVDLFVGLKKYPARSRYKMY